MTYSDLELHIAQVDSLISKSRKKYWSLEKRKIYKNRLKLFDLIANSNYQNFDIIKLKQSRYLLNIIAQEIEFLDFNNRKEIPFKLIECLKLVLKDWMNNPNLFTIVFSSNSKRLTDYYTLEITENTLKELRHICMSLGFEESYTHGLIHISQSRYFMDDFLSSVPIYHELGHFIDNYYGISEHASIELPYQKRYIAEHFADLFAAQYLSETIINKLTYTSYEQPGTINHPSTNNRISMINTFLYETGPDVDFLIIDQLNESTKFKTAKDNCEQVLRKKNFELSNNPFELDKKTTLQNIEEIHNLFIEGWNNFYFSEKYRETYPEPLYRLKRINKLINQTITLTLPKPTIFGIPTKLPRHWLR